MKTVEGICVTGAQGEGQQIAQRLRDRGVKGKFEPYNDGFSSFVADRTVERLLNISRS
jgi:hypothetical protein